MAEQLQVESVVTKKELTGFMYCFDRVFDTVETIFAKVTSGKFIATVLVVFTYCNCIMVAGRLVEASKINTETYIALMAGIGALAATIVKDYFNKEDKTTGG